MHRRHFLQYTAALGAFSALPFWSRFALAADRPALPIPPLLVPDIQNVIHLSINTGKSIFSGKPATTWGYNGSLLGPALKLTRGQAVTVKIHNGLAEETTVHWHGLEVDGKVDGGPQGVIAPGATRSITFTPLQRAATCWFHPHQHGKTGHQVAMGLGGLVLIEDSESSRLPLPKQWGMNDIPLIIQDKRFQRNGEIDYQLDIMSAAVGWFGDTLLCNGAVYPRHVMPRGWLRLRLLNGCNARSLNIAASDNRPFYVIASDGGLLAEPVRMTKLEMLTGERFEILIDTRNGRPFDMVTLPVTQMGMAIAPFDQPVPVVHIQPLMAAGTGTLPENLAKMPMLPPLEAVAERRLQLTMDPMLDMMGMQALMDKYGMQSMPGMSMNGHHNMKSMDHNGMRGMMHGDMKSEFDFRTANKINGKAFDMTSPAFAVHKGKYEKWIISGEGDMMLHPFHIHGTQFRILSENGAPVAAHRRGWKDTVKIAGSHSEVLVKFDHTASKETAYMAHCHLLEHEDTGMMLGFTVK